MIVKILKTLFERDLKKLKSEIEQYRSEEQLWYIEKDISNCAGNLCLHLVGNLQSFIGATLGGTDYIRQRELEFSLKDVPISALIDQIDATISMIDHTLSHLSDSDIEKEYPINVFGEKMTTGFFLMHLSTHLTYHLGQINYHRRLLDHG